MRPWWCTLAFLIVRQILGLAGCSRSPDAAELFEQGLSSPEVAGRLRVTPQAVNNWRRAWKAGGTVGAENPIHGL
jgi:hypothetical protein